MGTNQDEFYTSKTYISFSESNPSTSHSSSHRNQQNAQPSTINNAAKNQSGGELCKVCKLWLTSKVVALQHYAGQKHKKNALIEEKKSSNSESGFKFTYSPENASYLSIVHHQVKCELCCVFAPNNPSFEAHLNGKKHLKLLQDALTAAEKGPNQADQPIEPTSSDSASTENKLSEIVIKPESKEPPKETLRCEVCNVDLMCEENRKAHMEGKKHLKKVSTLTGAPNQKIKEEDDLKFGHLAIAWHKYQISIELRLKTGNQFEYYCSLCDKYIQRKLQLIDHLKSQKHHNNIYEQRTKQKKAAEEAQASKINHMSNKRKESQESSSDSKRARFETYNNPMGEFNVSPEQYEQQYSINHIYASYHQSNSQS